MKDALLQGGVEVLIAFLALVCAYLAAYLRRGAARLQAQTQGIMNETEAEIVRTAIRRIDDLAERTVTKMEQTVAGELRQAVKDGKVDREELLAIGKQAVDEVVSMTGPELMVILEKTFGDAQTFIENTIETKVREVKDSLTWNNVPSTAALRVPDAAPMAQTQANASGALAVTPSVSAPAPVPGQVAALQGVVGPSSTETSAGGTV
ncbi:hypothetical protein JCM15765_02460 [Paradesulfitobacterium aromaticivorans]